MAKTSDEKKVLQTPDGDIGESTPPASSADTLCTPSVTCGDSSLKEGALEEGKVGKPFRNVVNPMAELIAEEKRRMEEYVYITLFKDDNKYKDDVYVAVNGQNCRIQRGVPVKIKRKFALELAKSQHEDQRTAAKMALLMEEAAKAKL